MKKEMKNENSNEDVAAALMNVHLLFDDLVFRSNRKEILFIWT